VAASALLLEPYRPRRWRGRDELAVPFGERSDEFGIDEVRPSSTSKSGERNHRQGLRTGSLLGCDGLLKQQHSWWSNYGQLRRSTDRKHSHRLAAIDLASTVIIIARLINYRDR
jgi:hypothetical protein